MALKREGHYEPVKTVEVSADTYDVSEYSVAFYDENGGREVAMVPLENLYYVKEV